MDTPPGETPKERTRVRPSAVLRVEGRRSRDPLLEWHQRLDKSTEIPPRSFPVSGNFGSLDHAEEISRSYICAVVSLKKFANEISA